MCRCFLAVFVCMVASIAHAQESSGNTCKTSAVLTPYDSLKKNYESKGFALVKAAQVYLNESATLPVLIRLQGQHQYEIVFVGDPAASVHQLTLLDNADKDVAHQAATLGAAAKHIVSCAYQPPQSGWYTIKASQDKASSGSCYLMLLQKNPAGKPLLAGVR